MAREPMLPIDFQKAKLTEELRKNLEPNQPMDMLAGVTLDVLKEYIASGQVKHVCLLITFHDGGSKYYAALQDTEPLIIDPGKIS